MSIAATVAQLRELALALPRDGCVWEERPRFDAPATPQAVLEIERAARFVLPVDLRSFLEETASIEAMSVHNGYWLGRVMQLIDEVTLPRIAEGDAAIPVATDGGGNAFLLSASGGVWRWDRETGKVQRVAPSFGAFLEQVAKDWAAYISDQPGWRFLV